MEIDNVYQKAIKFIKYPARKILFFIRTTSKFYFFDIGVAGFLQGRRGLKMRSPKFGEAFEAYIHHEIKTCCDFNKGSCDLSYWRSTSGFEVDFIINGKTAVEVKGKANITRKDFKGLIAIKEEELLKKIHFGHT